MNKKKLRELLYSDSDLERKKGKTLITGGLLLIVSMSIMRSIGLEGTGIGLIIGIIIAVIGAIVFFLE